LVFIYFGFHLRSCKGIPINRQDAKDAKSEKISIRIAAQIVQLGVLGVLAVDWNAVTKFVTLTHYRLSRLIYKYLGRSQPIYFNFMNPGESRANERNLLLVFEVSSTALNNDVSRPGNVRHIKLGR